MLWWFPWIVIFGWKLPMTKMVKQTSCIFFVVSPLVLFYIFLFTFCITLLTLELVVAIFRFIIPYVSMFAQVAPYERPALSKAYLFPECKFVMLLCLLSILGFFISVEFSIKIKISACLARLLNIFTLMSIGFCSPC